MILKPGSNLLQSLLKLRQNKQLNWNLKASRFNILGSFEQRLQGHKKLKRAFVQEKFSLQKKEKKEKKEWTGIKHIQFHVNK